MSRVSNRILIPNDNWLVDDTGEYPFNPDILPQEYTYDASGQIETVSYGPDSNGDKFVQTYTYVNGQLSSVSAWVRVIE